MNNLMLGWQLMGFGLLGVFITLILFIVVIVLVTKLFPYKEDRKENN